VKIAAITLCTAALLSALEPSVVPHDAVYFTQCVRNTELIYTEANRPVAAEAAAVETLLQPLYEALYGYRMDEPLYVGLTSRNNQIANGYSTPYPNNRQINYPGGALAVDYFASTSWLKTLLYHETSHNYQMNAKESGVSRGLHTLFGNGSFLLPWFTLPNIVESSFLLEGNSVLNESYHGNGGRLYSGRFKAATLQQARSGRLKAERLFNDNYDFLYGSHHYTLGGYYQYYLAEQYGLEAVNAYWRHHSREWYWPFFTNATTERSYGADFETTFARWRGAMEAEAALLVESRGEPVARTQFFTPLNGDAEAIYFTVNATGRDRPELVVYEKKTGGVSRSGGGYLPGKVVRTKGGVFATQAGTYTSPWRITQGLFDADAVIVEGTASKVVEGYLGDGTPVWFDVPSSFEMPQLYVGERFYGQVNSSVLVGPDDALYYFVQEGKTRTLYRDRTPLFTIRGYYGHPCGVDSRGGVYFVANTPHGSGLFCFAAGKLTRASRADTVIDARLIDDGSVLAAVMGADAYRIEKLPLEAIDEEPFEVTLFVEREPYYRAADPERRPADTAEMELTRPYGPLAELHYSGTDIALGADSEGGLLYSVSVNFADPLTLNALALFALRNADGYSLGGLSYANSAYFLNYALSAYGVIGRPGEAPATDSRDFGLIADAAVPFLRRGHWRGALRGSYYQDYESGSRKPLSVSTELQYTEQYGVSMYPNRLLSGALYAAADRGDRAYGGEGAGKIGLGAEWYAGVHGQYARSDAETFLEARGIKLTDSETEKFAESDPTTVVMPSLRSTAYFKSILKAGASLSKVFNADAYFFTFPVSLRRESVTLSWDRYRLEPFGNAESVDVNELGAELTLDLFWFNRLAAPLNIAYYHNDNDLLADEHTVRVMLGFAY